MFRFRPSLSGCAPPARIRPIAPLAAGHAPMARSTHLPPGHPALQDHYATLKTFSAQHVEHEGALETAFSHLLAEIAKPHGWLLIPKLSMKVGGKSIAPDG